MSSTVFEPGNAKNGNTGTIWLNCASACRGVTLVPLNNGRRIGSPSRVAICR
ncbi:hypothetical protein [Pseudomonas amygdali]|uniref:hypothetical protein n=1 Tax=Pseudomonas amygdali TaxID=47877 RepID=UPI001F4879A2|nr:hypothetical protein [Pseudomonas amygdali]